MSIQTALSELPKSIRVGAFDIEMLVGADLASQNWGYYESAKGRIVIFDSPTSVHRLVETVIHEISHAIYDVAKMEDKDQEERVVATFSVVWVQVYRDNPALLRWISKYVK